MEPVASPPADRRFPISRRKPAVSASRPPPDSDRSAPGSLSWIVPILFLAGMGGWFYYAGSDRTRPALPDGSAQQEQLRISDASAVPCNIPLRWSTQVEDGGNPEESEALRAAVRAAVGIWEAGVERSLFQGHPTEGFPVRFSTGPGAAGNTAGEWADFDPTEAVARFVERVRFRSGRVVSVERAVEVSPGGNLQYLVLPLARELGHALGLPDSDATGALMNRRTRLEGRDPAEFPTGADIEALRRACGGA